VADITAKRKAAKRARRAEVEDRVIQGRVPRAAYSIPEFCVAHRISEGLYYKLRKQGLGPREMRSSVNTSPSIPIHRRPPRLFPNDPVRLYLGRRAGHEALGGILPGPDFGH
jgi:hypothetical protein